MLSAIKREIRREQERRLTRADRRMLQKQRKLVLDLTVRLAGCSMQDFADVKAALNAERRNLELLESYLYPVL